MPAIIELTKTKIISEVVTLIIEDGYENLNIRKLAKRLDVSTKPLYRIYKSMDEIKADADKKIYELYDEFVNENIDHKNPLLSISISYVEFAQQYKNLFISLFLSNNLKWQSIDEVLDEKWNQATIVSMVNKEGRSFGEAKELFMDIWLYANGLATLVATNEVKMTRNEIREKIIKIYQRLAI
ncbi:MAG: TetR/AcrR family transcriptional regulator [bacterium]